MFPQNLYVESLIPHVIAFAIRTDERELYEQGKALIMGSMPLYEGTWRAYGRTQ